jgi:hypothetical protein
MFEAGKRDDHALGFAGAAACEQDVKRVVLLDERGAAAQFTSGCDRRRNVLSGTTQARPSAGAVRRTSEFYRR